MALSDEEAQQVAAALMPLFQRAIQAAVAEAVARALTVRAITGVITAVTGADAVVEPDDNPGTFTEATVTNASDQVAGVQCLVLTLGQGSSFVIGVIP